MAGPAEGLEVLFSVVSKVSVDVIDGSADSYSLFSQALLAQWLFLPDLSSYMLPVARVVESL